MRLCFFFFSCFLLLQLKKKWWYCKEISLLFHIFIVNDGSTSGGVARFLLFWKLSVCIVVSKLVQLCSTIKNVSQSSGIFWSLYQKLVEKGKKRVIHTLTEPQVQCRYVYRKYSELTTWTVTCRSFQRIWPSIYEVLFSTWLLPSTPDLTWFLSPLRHTVT